MEFSLKAFIDERFTLSYSLISTGVSPSVSSTFISTPKISIATSIKERTRKNTTAGHRFSHGRTSLTLGIHSLDFRTHYPRCMLLLY